MQYNVAFNNNMYFCFKSHKSATIAFLLLTESNMRRIPIIISIIIWNQF